MQWPLTARSVTKVGGIRGEGSSGKEGTSIVAGGGVAGSGAVYFSLSTLFVCSSTVVGTVAAAVVSTVVPVVVSVVVATVGPKGLMPLLVNHRCSSSQYAMNSSEPC